MIPYLMLLGALLLILLEFYLPGGVMGGVGALMLLSSIVIIAVQSDSPLEIILFVILSIAGLIAVVKGALWHIRKTQSKRSIFLESDQEGFRASQFEKEMIGKQGEALADMRPGGHILIEGKKYQAISIGGFIPKGTKVEVMSGQGESLYIKEVKS